MVIQTSRFGKVEITEEDVISFHEGLLGFQKLRKFVLLDDPNDEIFAWLQSCEDGAVAFPVLEPELFVEQYTVSLTRSDLEAVGVTSGGKSLRYFTIVTIPEDPTQMTANLKAPIVIDIESRRAKQCVLQDNQLAIREPIFSRLQQRVVQNPTQPFKSQAPEMGVRVRVHDDAALKA